MKKEVLAAFFLIVLLGTGALLVNIPTVALASTDEGEGNQEQGTESNDDESTDEETEPEPEGTPPEPPIPTDEPILPPTTLTQEPIIEEEEKVPDCKEGYFLNDNDKCIPEPLTELGELVGPPPECTPEQTPLECLDAVVKVTPPLESPSPELPPCDGSTQDCITPNGDICLEGQGGHECECAEDMSDCPNHPSLQEPVTPGPDEDCLFHPELPKCASDNGDCPDGFFQNEDGNCVPSHPNGCPEGFHGHEDDETGRCIPDSTPCDPGFIIDPDFPTCNQKERVCEEHPEIDACKTDDGDDDDDDNDDDDIDIRVKTVIKNIDIHKTIDNSKDFPDIDIIGLSLKDSGEAMVCAMNIDEDWVQCQEFDVAEDRINEDVWRVIEVDSDKDFDNADTGSEDVDDSIDAIKSQDFSELDDLSNHEFDIDLAAVGINPQGDGLVCLINDPDGTALCEPFKVSNEAVTGQITEIAEIDT